MAKLNCLCFYIIAMNLAAGVLSLPAVVPLFELPQHDLRVRITGEKPRDYKIDWPLPSDSPGLRVPQNSPSSAYHEAAESFSASSNSGRSDISSTPSNYYLHSRGETPGTAHQAALTDAPTEPLGLREQEPGNIVLQQSNVLSGIARTDRRLLQFNYIHRPTTPAVVNSPKIQTISRTRAINS